MNPDYLDNSTEAKARRNVLIAAGITFIVANLKLESNVLEILSLRFIVEPDRLVAAGQLICILLLGIFLLRATPRAIANMKAIWLKRFIRAENGRLMMLRMELYGYDGDMPSNGSPDEDFREAADELTRERERKQNLFDYWEAFSLALASLFVDFILPATLGLLAILNPYSVSAYLIPFAQQLQ